MRNTTFLVLSTVLLCGCGGKSHDADEPGQDAGELPVLAMEYLDELCKKGDAESCNVLDTLGSMQALCESGQQDGCKARDDIVEALEGLNAALAEEKCMDPCSEECLETCAVVADDETGPCLDECMASCVGKGCD